MSLISHLSVNSFFPVFLSNDSLQLLEELLHTPTDERAQYSVLWKFSRGAPKTGAGLWYSRDRADSMTVDADDVSSKVASNQLNPCQNVDEDQYPEEGIDRETHSVDCSPMDDSETSEDASQAT